jgi:hypothetical protein
MFSLKGEYPMGKNTQKYVISDPDSPATKGQTYTIYLTTGIDVRETELTKGDASMAIDKVNSGKAYHVRKAMIDIGGVIKRQDVIKNHRNDPKPRKTKAKTPKVAEVSEVDMLRSLLSGIEPADLIKLVKSLDTPAEAPKPKPAKKSKAKKPAAKKPAAKPKTKAEELGIDPVDITSAQTQRILKNYAATGTL